MLQVASGIVRQYARSSNEETVPLVANLAWTASNIHATLGDLTEAYDNAKARDLVEPLDATLSR
jgi:hypothetical protein